ncbi:MAG: hypothetical protein H0U50_03265 [Pyrinomonadaceae bacterium]|nr:hypothetical protein [Pyrinomonadaceae bacterium]
MKKLILFTVLALTATGSAKSAAATSNDPTETNQSKTSSSGQTTDNQSHSAPDEPTKRAQSDVTGTYYYKSGGRLNVMEVQKTGGSLRATFAGIYEYKTDGELMNNASGTEGVITAKLNGNSAVLQMKEYPDCRITLKFTGGKLIVRQEEDCGFAGHVTADGVYVKRSSEPPQFNRAWSSEEYEKLPDTTINAGRIRFAAGKREATVNGKISETQKEFAYLIGARKGQTLEVIVSGGSANNDVGCYFIAPDGLNLMGEGDSQTLLRAKLPQTGDYKIVVSANETENANFKMRVIIR